MANITCNLNFYLKLILKNNKNFAKIFSIYRINMLLNNTKVPKLTENSEIVKYLKTHGESLESIENVAISLLKTMEGTRIIKTHLPLDLIPKWALENSKVSYFMLH